MSGIMFEPMNLNMKADENVKEFYSERVNISGDAGLDLYVPETITVPANSIGFKINHNVRCEAKKVKIRHIICIQSSIEKHLFVLVTSGYFDSGYRVCYGYVITSMKTL